MYPYHELERDLAHIKSAISLLEQTGAYFSVRNPVSDPAYWRARLKATLSNAAYVDVAQKQIEHLLRRLDHLQTRKADEHATQSSNRFEIERRAGRST
ncbi:hypothetical protein SAMN05192539_104949 [Paraburkholderia diazotrophica]|uniref:Uncharacterized protein n=1 Tax=Paraburkholderia diazotrophica TaxID=667676 RepID=A0A1H7EAD9_9BURK|nr:hypothetical protein SAMN05192539_104949 [Paraburkholderia diazotrophica]